MHVRHPEGYLELELGDFKDNRRFRIMAVDHDLVSFVDVALRADGQLDWPLVLITNPKDAHYLIPRREPVDRIASSTHIRLLAFSSAPIASIRVQVDGTDVDAAQIRHIDGPLWVAPWTAPRSPELHSIVVTVRDAVGRERRVEAPFSTNGRAVPLRLRSNVLLMTDMSVLVRAMFFFLYAMLTVTMTAVPLLLASCRCRLRHWRPLAFWRTYELRIVRWAATDRAAAWMLLAYLAYIFVGPWFVGELVRGDRTGAMFVHGILVGGHFLRGGLTYLYGFYHLAFTVLPAWSLLVLWRAVVDLELQSSYARAYWLLAFAHLGYQTVACFDVAAWYGAQAALVAPAKLGFLLLSALLLRRAYRTAFAAQ